MGITVNLSGLSTGTFDVGYATGAISGSGSSMTIGVTDVGTSLADAVSLTSDGITELNLVVMVLKTLLIWQVQSMI